MSLVSLRRYIVGRTGIYGLVLALILTGVVAIGTRTTAAKSVGELLDRLQDPDGPVMVVSHKGDWRNYPENSLPGIQAAIDMGVDIVEIDIQRTSDGVLVLMHDSSLDRTTNGTGNVSGKTLAQIKALKLREGQGGGGAVLTNETVPTLAEAMNLMKGKVLVNLDKGWDLRDQIWDVLVSTGTENQGIFKSNAPNSTVDAWLDSKSPRPLYAAVVQDSDIGIVDGLLTGAQPDMYELIFDSESDAVIAPANVNKISNANKRIWINTLWASLAANHTDAGSLIDPESGWGWVINKGATIIQTDYSRELINYLNLREPLLAGWAPRDVGAVALTGSSGYRDGQFTLSAAGYDIWTAADEFHYVYQPVEGDVTIVARVLHQDATNGWAKAGVMIRETLDADSKFADVVVTPSNGISFQRRVSTGQNLSNTTGYYDSVPGGVSEFVKLVRSGDTFTGYKSADGVSWTQIGSPVALPMNSAVYVGLAATSHNAAALGISTFDRVAIEAASPYETATVSLRQGAGYSEAADAHILEYSTYSGRNTGGHELFEATTYRGTAEDEKHALLRFGLPASIPSDAIVTSAQLRIKLIGTRNGMAGKTVNLREVLEAWEEGTGTGIDGEAVSGVSWNNRPAYGSVSLDKRTIHNVRNGWYTFNVTDLVQAWLGGGKANYGVVLLEDPVVLSPGAKDFASSEYSDEESRPSLVITYRLP
ncbi:DNRLRE domain-containing protein [Cohnella cellulosilytica]|uniref:DNRLRE domain-containing protein n=2 Tax=Cohnella cellulosilytica TaxID=986710 RepID=A0ABW2F8L0_9BACL